MLENAAEPLTSGARCVGLRHFSGGKILTQVLEIPVKSHTYSGLIRTVKE
jgi:hypothetical protein